VRAADFLATYRDLFRIGDPLNNLSCSAAKRMPLDNTLLRPEIWRLAGLRGELGDSSGSKGKCGRSNGRWLVERPNGGSPATLKRSQCGGLNAMGGPNAHVIGASRLVFFNAGLLLGSETQTHFAWRVNVEGVRPDDGFTTYGQY